MHLQTYFFETLCTSAAHHCNKKHIQWTLFAKSVHLTNERWCITNFVAESVSLETSINLEVLFASKLILLVLIVCKQMAENKEKLRRDLATNLSFKTEVACASLARCLVGCAYASFV